MLYIRTARQVATTTLHGFGSGRSHRLGQAHAGILSRRHLPAAADVEATHAASTDQPIRAATGRYHATAVDEEHRQDPGRRFVTSPLHPASAWQRDVGLEAFSKSKSSTAVGGRDGSTADGTMMPNDHVAV